MATIDTAYYVPTFLGLSTTFGISCAVSATCIIAFEICKRLESMNNLFSPRTQLLKNPVKKQSRHIFAWVSSVFLLDETDYVAQVGLDATMHIRFLRMVVHFLTVQSLFVCPILLGLHWTGATTSLDHADLANEFTSLAKNESTRTEVFSNQFNHSIDHFRSNSTLYYLSIANIPNKNPIVWVHVFFTFSTSLVWLWLLFVNHIHHIDLLQQQPLKNRLHERSVLITHVPHNLRNSQSLQQHFDQAQIGTVEKVTLVSNTAIKLVEGILKKRRTAIDKLEMLLIGMVSSELPNVDWYTVLTQIKQMPGVEKLVLVLNELQVMDKEILRLRDVNRSPEYYMPTGAAFVTFNSAYSAQICAQIVTSWKPGVFDTRMAPEPRDVLWRSLLRRGRKDRITGRFRQWIVFAAVWSLTIFWLFPISFILGLTSMQSLSQHFTFLQYFLNTSFLIRSFIQNILPTLLVTLFMSFLPWILLEISKQQDFVSYSELEDSVLGRYYHFAIFNVLIVFLLGSTFLTTMLDVLYEPTMLIQLLANALPQGANFFLNYILFNSSTHAMELIQLGSQLFGHILLTLPCISKTPRIRMRHTTPWSFPYYYYYPNHILVLVITLTYSVIQPLILIFSSFYFAFALTVYRHQYMYCYIRRYETGGSRHYRKMTRYTSDGLLIFQFTMVGLLYLKGVIPAATAILPLIIFTIWFKVKLNSLFQRRSKHPYIGRFDTINGHLKHQDQLLKKSAWRHVDDVWKFSYIKNWWAAGRYAQHSCNNQSTMHLSTLQQQIRSLSAVQSDITAVPNRLGEEEEDDDEEMYRKEDEEETLSNTSSIIMMDTRDDCDLSKYPDDSKSPAETYEHPALTEPLVTDLILPRSTKSRKWNIKECVLVPLDVVSYVLLDAKQDTTAI
ncbi:hypothetical protein MFLAVUS_010637 [Mucor flavus]|uniref:DUF221-domain-containing protein n=1 Tax=Mucor flavus TaxID=439312 RepID=A0ABP9ZDB0_9FUNG